MYFKLVEKNFIMLFLLIFGCKNNFQMEKSITTDEYEIYSLVIDSLSQQYNIKMLVLSDSTMKNKFEQPSRYYLNGEWLDINDLDKLGDKDSIWFKSNREELIKNYQLANQRSCLFNSDSIKCFIRLIQLHGDSLKKIFRSADKGWALFYKLFPESNGIMNVSRVGFNSDRKQAVFYASYGRGGLEGVGLYILLYKEGLKWEIKTITEAWIA